MKRALAIGLVALCSPALGGDRAAESAAAERAAAWLDERTSAIHSSPPAESSRLARQTIHEVHGRLVAEGLDPSLADVFAPETSEGASTGREIHLLDAARKRLRSFARASARPLPPVPAGARAEMERILQDSIFHLDSQKAGTFQRLVVWLRNVLFEVLSRFLQTASHHAVLVTVIVAAIMVAALLVFATKLLRVLRAGPRPSRPVRTTVLPTSSAEAIDPRALLAQARDSAAAGRGRTAIKLLEMASVIALRSRGEIPTDPGLTDLEAVRWLGERGRSEIRASFERLSTLHDGIVYGGREAAVAALEEALRLAHALVAGIPEPAS